jgi:nucleotide-binding universal stress UspA family protein
VAQKVSRILVPVSGSPFDEEVVSLACDIGHDAKAAVWVLYVLQVPRALPLDAEVPAEAARGEQVLQQMERLGKARKCKLEGEILQARDVGPAVVDEAVARNVDLIVAGASYQEHYGSPTLGEVVPYLLKHSPCRVLVYRASQDGAPVGASA